MTSDTFGLTSGTPLATWHHGSRCWKTLQATFLSDWEPSLESCPSWGTARGGVLYALPTPVRLTAVGECSSLPTPTARDHKEQTLGWTWQRDGVTQEDTLPRAITALLPTPRATTAMGDPMDLTLDMYEKRGKPKGRLEESIAILTGPSTTPRYADGGGCLEGQHQFLLDTETDATD